MYGRAYVYIYIHIHRERERASYKSYKSILYIKDMCVCDSLHVFVIVDGCFPTSQSILWLKWNPVRVMVIYHLSHLLHSFCCSHMNSEPFSGKRICHHLPEKNAHLKIITSKTGKPVLNMY